MRIITQYLLPHKLICWLAHISANCKIIWIKNFLIGYFIKRYPVNMSEARESDPFAYPNYNYFFTRALKPECRPIDPANDAIVSPADGSLAQFGLINQLRIIQAKGHDYSATELLGGDAELASNFINGQFATIYLAPKDYHRVHMPLDGRLRQMIYVPGNLFSVNSHAAENIPNLFARNERLVCIFDTVVGPMAVVLVGAMIVGSIETVWQGKITPPHGRTSNAWDYDAIASPIELDKGAELGRFKLGSTVILLFGANVATWNSDLTLNMNLKFGSKLGTILYEMHDTVTE